MRIYKDFREAHGEILRDIAEMGSIVRPKTMQNKLIAGNPDYETLEIQNYAYTVTDPQVYDLNPTQPWADAEFTERVGPPQNPGRAWELRPETWTEFLNDDGKFCYSYSERYGINSQLVRIIEHIKKDPDSRQLYLSMWDPNVDSGRLGRMRVPCSLGYLFQVRNGKLSITYNMRSCDFITHFQNDCYLTHRLQKYVATQTGYEIGNFTHFINSLHMYRKDAKGVF